MDDSESDYGEKEPPRLQHQTASFLSHRRPRRQVNMIDLSLKDHCKGTHEVASSRI